LFWVVKENLFSFHITGDFKMFESKISLPILNLVGYSLAVFILTQIFKDLKINIAFFEDVATGFLLILILTSSRLGHCVEI